MRCSAHSAIGTIGYSDYKLFFWIFMESHACSAPRAFTKAVKTPRNFEPWFEFELDQPRHSDRIRDCIARTMFRLWVEESLGMLLRVSFRHKKIANLVGASRPRVTEYLARLEREKFVTRQGRQMIVQVAGFRNQSDTHLICLSICVANVKNRSSCNAPEVASTHRSTRLNTVGLSSPGNRWHAWPHAVMVKSTRAFLFE